MLSRGCVPSLFCCWKKGGETAVLYEKESVTLFIFSCLKKYISNFYRTEMNAHVWTKELLSYDTILCCCSKTVVRFKNYSFYQKLHWVVVNEKCAIAANCSSVFCFCRSITKSACFFSWWKSEFPSERHQTLKFFVLQWQFFWISG